jgi:3-oxoacyl-[acyl-carrier protein] reductase
MSIEGKVALVTGGGRGIGRAVSLRLAAMGCIVAVNYVSRPDAAEETVAAIEKAGGRGMPIQFDVADGASISGGVKEVTASCGAPDILINNAGITRDGLMARMKEQDWDLVLSTNLKGAFLCSKAVMRPMMKKRWGRIINISSVIGFLGNSGQVNYAAAKAGMTGLTKAMARELAPRKVTVNSVAPGYIVTDMTSDLSEDIQEMIRAQIPLGSLGQPEDVAACVAFLVSEESGYLTGQTLHVNGGMYMGN